MPCEKNPLHTITKEQARRFMLLKHGLMGDKVFTGKQGVLDFVRQVGCIQFDPIDVCGKNAELVLQSRVKGFTKQILYDLLYSDRVLVDYFDKNLSVFAVEDWKYFERERERYRKGGRSHSQINVVRKDIVEAIKSRGALSSADLKMSEKVDWYWGHTKLSRAALEYLYFCGELAIHHKKGSIKYYDLIKNCMPAKILNEVDPHENDYEHNKWRVLRRIGAVGMLWNCASDAWLNIAGLKAEERNRIFADLIGEGKIIEVNIEGVKLKLHFLSEDEKLFNTAIKGGKVQNRCEIIAALDNFLWDRKLIKALFNFDYKWEIYTPVVQRKYSYYVLPLLYRDSLVGRIEAVCDRKNRKMTVKNVWLEQNFESTTDFTAELNSCIEYFAKFNECDTIETPKYNLKEK